MRTPVDAVASSRIAWRRKVPFKIELCGLPLERTLTDEHDALAIPEARSHRACRGIVRPS